MMFAFQPVFHKTLSKSGHVISRSSDTENDNIFDSNHMSIDNSNNSDISAASSQEDSPEFSSELSDGLSRLRVCITFWLGPLSSAVPRYRRSFSVA